jgi:hypothetical protein
LVHITDDVEKVEGSAFTGENVLGRLCPDEGLRICVVPEEVIVDRVFDVGNV